MEQLGSHWTQFDKSLYLRLFSKICREISCFIQVRKRIAGTLRWRRFHICLSRWSLLRMRNVSNKSCRGNQNTHFVFNNFCFWKSSHLWDNVEKYGGARQAADSNMATRCMLSSVRLHACKRTPVPVHPPIHTHTHERMPRAHTHRLPVTDVLVKIKTRGRKTG